MRVKFDCILNKEIKEFLSEQPGIIGVDLVIEGFISEINITFNEDTTPEIIMKYINMFQENKYSVILSFDKEIKGEFKVLKYVIPDMCCEYCYRSFVEDLFENIFIKSIKSNFESYKPSFNIEFIIEYCSNYDGDKLIEFIKEKYGQYTN